MGLTDMYTDGTYLKKNPTWDIADSPWKAGLISSIIKKNKIDVSEIADVGCGAGAVLQELEKLHPSVKKFTGYDISPDAIKLAATRASEKISFLHADFVNNTGADKRELLLVIDVIEHVEDYYGFTRQLNAKGDYFVFHIPLDLSCRTLLKPHVLFQQRESVGHIHYFSRDMIFWLLKDTGYQLLDWHYTKPMGDILPAKNSWQGIKKTGRNIFFRLSKRLSDKLWGGYSMLILAKRNDG